jgi:small subunit ribosomal protein S15
MITVETKKELVKSYGATEADTGSPSVQIALLTERIKMLSGHLGTHKKDYSSMRGMMKLIGRRRTLLKSLQKKNPSQYESVVKNLDLRK